MAAIKITINGVICDMYGRTISGPVKIVGEAMYSDRGVGGGPMPPEGPVDPGYGIPAPPGWEQGPPHIWGPTDPRPTHPISGIPGLPGYEPKPPDYPKPPQDGMAKPPPPDGGWGYSPEYGWGYFPPDDQAQPKK